MCAYRLRIAVICLLASSLSSKCLSARAEEFQPTGRWKLVFAMQGIDLLLLDVTAQGDGYQAKLIESFPGLGKISMKSFAYSDGQVALAFSSGAGDIPFNGRPVTEGDNAGRVLGTFRLRGSLLPAWLEKTDDDKLPPAQPSPIQTKLMGLMRSPNAVDKVKKIEELIHENTGPSVQMAYQALFQLADAGQLTEEQVREHLERWLEGAAAFGPEWAAQCRLTALQMLQGKERYAKLNLELSQQALQGLAANASTDERVAVYELLASSARVADKDDLAAEADAKLAELNAVLDEEYHAKVPPFKPEPFGGRESEGSDRVVLLELFTGAQCPPCVAADVAFDALLSTFKPTELVTMQYHLHIPGPDPLTNSDTVSRGQYYGLRGTPTAYFSGETTPAGGGSMEMSQAKYEQYRNLIEKRLAGKKAATIDLKVTRAGEVLAITALAKAAAADSKNGKGGTKPENGGDDEPNDGDQTDVVAKPKVFLRLALTEESIRYVGGNRLRFHHHVVRDFPGGVEGKQLEAGEAAVTLDLDLNDVRAKITDYLDEFTKQSPFPAPIPKLELKNLALIAFVQDDATKRVLHAVEVPVPEAN